MTEASANPVTRSAFDRAHDLRAEVLREFFRTFVRPAPAPGRAPLASE